MYDYALYADGTDERQLLGLGRYGWKVVVDGGRRILIRATRRLWGNLSFIGIQVMREEAVYFCIGPGSRFRDKGRCVNVLQSFISFLLVFTCFPSGQDYSSMSSVTLAHSSSLILPLETLDQIACTSG